jgi:hypothetical protein
VEAEQELNTWAQENPEELLVLYVSHCLGQGCEAMTRTALQTLGVATVTDPEQLVGATYGSMRALGKAKGGGSLVAVFGLVEEEYDPTIQCYGESVSMLHHRPRANGSRTEAAVDWKEVSRLQPTLAAARTQHPEWFSSCYGSSAEREAAFAPLWTYLRQASSVAPSSTGELRMLQAHWQYSTSSIAQGVLHTSSILEDERR